MIVWLLGTTSVIAFLFLAVVAVAMCVTVCTLSTNRTARHNAVEATRQAEAKANAAAADATARLIHAAPDTPPHGPRDD